jgi:PAS domain S-box-containing protein
MDYFGWSRDEFVGLSLNAMRMPGEPEPAETEAGPQPSKPWRYRGKNKRGLWVELSNHEIETVGAPARLMTVNDVTSHVVNEVKSEQAQRRLEGEVTQKTVDLQTTEAQWRTLAEALPQFVWSARRDGFFDYVSNQWAEYAGVPSAELRGTGWLTTLHPDDRALAESRWSTALKTGGNYDVEYRIRAKDGSYRQFVAHGMPVRYTSEGAITHWMGTSSDKEDAPKKENLELALA